MVDEPFDGDARWIWGPGGTWDPPSPPESPFRVCYFRRTFDAPEGAGLTVHVSADSAYVLFLNGERASRSIWGGRRAPSRPPEGTSASAGSATTRSP